jgi:hypothetical protein
VRRRLSVARVATERPTANAKGEVLPMKRIVAIALLCCLTALPLAASRRDDDPIRDPGGLFTKIVRLVKHLVSSPGDESDVLSPPKP